MTSAGFICPVCGYDRLEDEPWLDGSPSDEICPACGIQFGYDDAAGGDPVSRERVHMEWRERWIGQGQPWSSIGRAKPPRWNPEEQLRRVR